ncbi:RING finger protein 37 [Lucilia sericata]|uniref:RING finger protein 37 n=1 Tax=Lucilia sericata TaxID=13632 RepID=UPI0018A8403C|nr:RING finger protein 37 [Lucilia sericata]
MSLINFLNPKLKPTVECDAVCEDGYGVSNLIADDAEQLQRGFMAFSVSKPPIEIVFEFPKAIDLKVIKLWNSHGALRSTAFELHGKYEGIWERVAYVRDLAKDVDSLTFCYQSDYSSKSSEQQSSEKVFFFKTAHKMLSNTNSIKLIIRATQKCPPVLRKVQVWGLPARSLDKADRELVKSIWNEITNPYDYGGMRQRDDDAGQRSPSRSIPELNKYSTLKIPEEFLDAITWELMIFPTVLPSGKVVDQSTIDKHSEEEAKWGRLPSDPFTGLEFTPHRKAILNLALKARIEKFLMENSEHFKTVPRSLGSSRVRRSKNRHASQFASLCHQHTPGVYSSLSKSYKTTATATLSSTDGNNTDLIGTVGSASSSFDLPAKRARLMDSTALASYTTTTASKSRLNKKYTTSVTSSTTLTSCSTPLLLASTATQTSATATASFSKCSTLTREANAAKTTTTSTSATATSTSSGIDQAIQQALQKITRFSQLPLKPTPQPVSCIKCQTTEFSYEIQTCGHLVCRECLVTLTRDEQCICSVTFRSADVERYHRL